MSAPDAELMRRALRLAQRGWGRVHPNPMVGALVVHEGVVVGEGWHQEYGGAHAEVHALRAAGEAARGATLYVTLEPCNHHGRTPPCTEAVLAAGVRRVVIGALDPNPQAQGGAGRLRDAGVEVETGVAAAESESLNAAFFHWHRTGEPFVALKLALTLDGAIAGAGPARTLITGDAARAEANRLRAGYDAVLVGANTARLDDPLLTVRDHPVRIPPLRVVLDSEARLPPDSRLVRTVSEAPVLVLTADDVPPERAHALHAAGVSTAPVERGPGGLDSAAALQALAERGVRSVFAEGGGALARTLLGAERVQRLYLFLAPRLLGAGAVRAFEPWPDAPASEWRLVREARFGDDVLLVLDRRYPTKG